MRRIVVLAVLVLALGPAGAHGQTTPTVDALIASCPTAAEIAAINSELSLSFEGDPTAPTLVCTAAGGSANLTRLQERAYQALRVMRQVQFTRPLPWTSRSLWAWLNGAIDGIRFRNDIEFSFCCDPARTINIQTRNLAALHTVRWADPQQGSGLHGLVELIAHESRHSEGPSHTCGGDDATYAEGGAWALQHDLALWFGLYSGAFLDAPDPDLGYYRSQEVATAETLLTRFCTLPRGDLAVSIVDSPDPVEINGVLTYTATVTNAGPDAAPNVSLYLETPRLAAEADSATVSNVSASQGSCTVQAGGTRAVGCSLGTIGAGGSATVTVSYTVPGTGGTLANSFTFVSVGALVTGTIRDPSGTNNTATVRTTVFVPMCFGRPAGGTTLIGTERDDRIIGTSRADLICGRGGNDVIVGGGGNDSISGGVGADRITGGPGRDRLLGDAGNDTLLARDKRRDVVAGGAGLDIAEADRGLDVVTGVERRR